MKDQVLKFVKLIIFHFLILLDYLEMNINSTDLIIFILFGIFTVLFVYNIRRRVRSADNTFATTHRKITRRLAGENGTLEIQKTESKAISTDDWNKGRRQVILCSGILVLVTIISVVSCIRTSW